MSYRGHSADRKMNKTMRKALYVLVVMLATCSIASAKASCGSTALPARVVSELTISYADWKVVGLEMLSPEEQAIWKDEHSRECPGFADGHFTGTSEEIAVNLVKSSQGKLYQQVVLFHRASPSMHAITILAPMEVASISVVLKMEPGRYISSNSGKGISIRRDSIAVAALEKGTIQYYWNGKGFTSIITSE